MQPRLSYPRSLSVLRVGALGVVALAIAACPFPTARNRAQPVIFPSQPDAPLTGDVPALTVPSGLHLVDPLPPDGNSGGTETVGTIGAGGVITAVVRTPVPAPSATSVAITTATATATPVTAAVAATPDTQATGTDSLIPSPVATSGSFSRISPIPEPTVMTPFPSPSGF